MEDIIYKTLNNNTSRGRVVDYHHSARPAHRHFAKLKDAKGLRKNQIKNIVFEEGRFVANLYQGSYLEDVKYDLKSLFTIGMEVEKNYLHRESIHEYALFKGFEYDGSCGECSNERGYEAITHILPLIPPSKWRSKVFGMMWEAEHIIDDAYSPSNSRCGGHISIGIDGMYGYNILRMLRKNCGILLALNRYRLRNEYCNLNPRMDIDWYNEESDEERYQVALVKSNTVEFRLFSRFVSVEQMISRYQLLYEIVDFSYNNPNGRHSTLLKRLSPILETMYQGDTTKISKILEWSELFRDYILSGERHPDIENYLPEYD